MDEKLVTIAEFDDYIGAEMAKQLLEDFGIKAIVGGANASNIYAGVPAVEGPVLQVLESDADEARKILEESKTNDEAPQIPEEEQEGD
jgi:hypothetical protein